MSRLRFAIIGAQKSASTRLQEALRQHPQVFIPGKEQPTFLDGHYSARGLSELELILSEAGLRISGIKSPDLLASREGPARLSHHSPQASIVVVLRNPVDRAVSAYFHYMRWGMLPEADVDAGMQALLAGQPPEGYPRALEVLDYGLYARHLSRWLKYFPRSRVHVLFQDHLQDHFQSALDDLVLQLGVEPHRATAAATRTYNEGAYSPTRRRYLAVVRPLCYRLEDNQKRIAWRSKTTAKALLGFDSRVLAPLLKGERPSLDGSTAEGLTAFYRRDVRELADLAALPDAWSRLL